MYYFKIYLPILYKNKIVPKRFSLKLVFNKTINMNKFIIIVKITILLCFIMPALKANNFNNYAINNNSKPYNFSNNNLTNPISNYLLKNTPTFKKLNFWQKLKYNIVKNKLIKLLKKYTFTDNKEIIDKNAKVSFILGLCSIPGFIIIGPFALVTGILAIIYGIKGLNSIKNSNGKVGGKSKAVTGIVLGAVAVLLGFLLIALLIAIFSNGFVR